MTLPVAIGVYFICWWLAFFIMLPIGVRTQADEGSIELGTADSAPLAPRLWIKALAATILSAIVFAAVYAVIAFRLIPLDRIPASL
jgi:predicted secreted protein